MARNLRCLVDEGYYHILTRGLDKRKIFRERRDYLKFLSQIEHYLDEYHIFIYHYALMGNHLHLLLKAQKGEELPKFLQVILQSYAIYFRKRYHSTGYVFQGRYKSLLIKKENYLLECARYIERNPLRAKIVTSPEEYEWTSYSFYSEGKKDGIIKEPNPLYLELGQTDVKRQNNYQNYILQERPYDCIVDKGLRIS